MSTVLQWTLSLSMTEFKRKTRHIASLFHDLGTTPESSSPPFTRFICLVYKMCLLRLPTSQNDVFMTCFLSNKRSKTPKKSSKSLNLRSWRTKVGRMSEKQIKTHLQFIISVVLCLTVTSDLPVENERSHQESASHKHPCFTSGHQRAPAAQLCRQPVRQQEVWGGSSYGWICSGRGSTHTHIHTLTHTRCRWQQAEACLLSAMLRWLHNLQHEGHKHFTRSPQQRQNPSRLRWFTGITGAAMF